ncbi:hypothetical protein HDU98_000193 [Podochytrium sp. JEL0797]|nr:hypothetical protein HDU98_000193 [Podochytrium sp. JEL0797]
MLRVVAEQRTLGHLRPRTTALFATSTSSAPKKSRGNTLLLVSGVSLLGVSAYLFASPGSQAAPMSSKAALGGSFLSSAQADAVLRRQQVSLMPSPSQGSVVVRCDVAAVASNDPKEDFRAEHATRHGLLLAVMDGHGGTECADIVQKHLGAYVENALDVALGDPSNKQRGWFSAPKHPSKLLLPEMADVDDGPSPKKKEAITNALISAFTRLDDDIVNGSFDAEMLPDDLTTANMIRRHLRISLAGSCTLLAYIDGNDLYVACTGDSRAVIGRRKIDGVWESLDLSVDQTVRNIQEYNRLLEEHPGELETVVVKGRVLGGLMPTRAFGDSRYKWPKHLSEVLLPNVTNRNPPKNYFTPPYVTAKPVVTHYRITPSRDMFMVLATDGLYDELSSQEVVTVVSGFMQHQKIAAAPTVEWGSDPLANKALALTQDTNAATCLIRNALGGSNEEKVSKLLSIPAPYSRRFRDDMTVNVVFFDHDKNIPNNGLDKSRLLSGATDVVEGLPAVDVNLAGIKQHRLNAWATYFARMTGSQSKL